MLQLHRDKKQKIKFSAKIVTKKYKYFIFNMKLYFYTKISLKMNKPLRHS